jgi:hypothetical protein
MAGIKHKWTSPAADGADSTKLQPSKWNEDHGTAELDTTKVLAPDGTGGVAFRSEAGGGSPYDGTTPDAAIALEPADYAYSAVTDVVPGATYADGADGVGATLTQGDPATGILSVDGASPLVGQRIVVDLPTLCEPGIFDVTGTGDGVTIPWFLTRASDCDSPAKRHAYWACGILAGYTWVDGLARITGNSGGGSLVVASNYSHAEGTSSHAEGYSSHAEGNSSHAEGISSHAEGISSHAEGYSSHAEGISSHAYWDAQHAGAQWSAATHGQYARSVAVIRTSDETPAALSGGIGAYPHLGATRVVSARIVARRVGGPVSGLGIAEPGGSGYAPGDTVSLDAGTGDAVAAVDTVTAGHATGLTVTTPGTTYLPGIFMATTAIVGTGTDLVVVVEGTSGPREDAAWSIEGVLRGDGSALTWVGGSAPVPAVIAADPALPWSVAMDISDASLVITVTGESGKVIDWAAVIEQTEVDVFGFRYID